MAWSLQGTYVENCSCTVICPCTWSNLSRPATNDDCRAVLAFHVDHGEIDGVDVTGRTVVLVVLSPKMMVEGNWRVGLLADEGSSDDQIDRLTQVFSGAVGGPMAGLAPLIGEFLGAERAPVELAQDRDGWRLRVGDAMELAGTLMRGPESDDPVALTGIVAHPAGPVLTITPADVARWSVMGIDFAGKNLSGFTAPFSWAA
jgi:hypothetical protein